MHLLDERLPNENCRGEGPCLLMVRLCAANSYANVRQNDRFTRAKISL